MSRYYYERRYQPSWIELQRRWFDLEKQLIRQLGISDYDYDDPEEGDFRRGSLITDTTEAYIKYLRARYERKGGRF